MLVFQQNTGGGDKEISLVGTLGNNILTRAKKYITTDLKHLLAEAPKATCTTLVL